MHYTSAMHWQCCLYTGANTLTSKQTHHCGASHAAHRKPLQQGRLPALPLGHWQHIALSSLARVLGQHLVAAAEQHSTPRRMTSYKAEIECERCVCWSDHTVWPKLRTPEDSPNNCWTLQLLQQGSNHKLGRGAAPMQ